MYRDPGLTGKTGRKDLDPEMGFPFRSCTGMACMEAGFVDHFQGLRLKIMLQDSFNPVFAAQWSCSFNPWRSS